MTLIEAVQALKDGKADAISREIWDKSCRSFQFRDNGHGTLVNGHGSGPVQIESITATDWVVLKKRRESVSRAYCTIGSLIIPECANFYAEWVE